MFFALGDTNKRSFSTKQTQLNDGATQYTAGDDRHTAAVDKGTRHLFRFGSITKSGVASRNRRMKDFKKGDTVVLEFGCNSCGFDWKAVSEHPEAEHAPLMSVADFHDLYEQVIAQIRTLGARPILLSLPLLLPQRFFDYVSRGLNKDHILQWLGGDVNKLSEWYEQYNLELFRLAKEFDVPVIDITTVFVDRRSLGDCYGPDGMRPNKRGNAMISEAVITANL